MKTAVVALGKIGLPLAVQFADAGHEVIGVDVNAKQVELINQATEPFPGAAHLQEKLSELVPAGRLRATTDYSEAIPSADAVVIVTEWDAFRALDFDRLKRTMASPVLVDLRNIYRPEEITALGFTYTSIGR